MLKEASDKPKITVITPVYNEQLSLPNYEAAVKETLLNNSGYDIEILLVDDGSDDESWKIICAMCERDKSFKALRLSRNFGSHAALTAGFKAATGDAIATLACDLQDSPETIFEFLEKWRKGAAIVWGHRRKREDVWWRRLTSICFNKIISRFAMPRGSRFATGSFLLADRRVVDCFNEFSERNRVTFALFAWTGFDQEVVDYDRIKRKAGKSSWNLTRILKAGYDTFIGFSALPSNVIFWLATSTALISIILGSYIFLRWLFFDPLPGWTGLMLAMTFFFAVNFMVLSVLVQYLQRIFTEVAARPIYFISEARNTDGALD